MNSSTQTNNLKIGFNDYLALFIFVLYAFVDFIPQSFCYTSSEPQWVYLTIINIVVSGYLLLEKKLISDFNFIAFFKNKIILLYLIFVFFAGISAFVSINIEEFIINFSRLTIIAVGILNLILVFKNKKHLIFFVAQAVAILIFIQCFRSIVNFFSGFTTINISDLRTRFFFNHDNKNIFAANILVKIPFLIYCIYATTNWKKYLFAIALFCAFFVEFLLGTRAVLAAMFVELIIIIIGFLYFYFKIEKEKQYLKNIFISVICLFLAFGISYFFITNSHVKNDVNAVKKTEIISSDGQSMKIRLGYWESSIDLISKKPLLGVGLGNWKIHSIDYEQKYKSSFTRGVYTHNDFLQIAAETGVLNGIIYLVLFVFLVVLNLKKTIQSKDKEAVFSLVLLAADVGYFFDSFFNFPLSRPTMQVVFVFLIVLTILNLNSSNENENLTTKKTSILWFGIFVMAINLSNIYPNYQQFKAYEFLNEIATDRIQNKLGYEYIAKNTPSFPSLDNSGSPMEDIKAYYALKENKFDEALKSIKKSEKFNPYSASFQSLKSELYDKLKQKDSTLKYNKLSFEMFPGYLMYYEKYIQSLSLKKDTTQILSAFEKLKTENVSSNHFASSFKFLLDAGYSPKKSFLLLKQGIQKFPKDSLLARMQNDFEAIDSKMKNNKVIENPIIVPKKPISIQDYANKANELVQKGDFVGGIQNYLIAFEQNKADYVLAENLGMCYYSINDFSNALKYLKIKIDAKKAQNGKAEFVAAFCYLRQNNKQKACEFANKSLNLGYVDAKSFLKNNCN